MRTFQFTSARDAQAAWNAAAANGSSRYIAGGTCLVDLMKLDVETPETLIDIHRLPLDQISQTSSGGLRIGAMARNSALAFHPIVAASYPLLAEAILSGASPQLRNMATVGGNLMQRTRCTYFRDVNWACNKREPGAGCSARDGHHRNHAIFGTSDACFAAHPSDMCVALVALDATVETQGPDGVRHIPIQDFHRLPGDTPHVETALRPDELITAVELPKSEPGLHSRYLKVRDRESYEFALVSVGAVLDLTGGVIRSARIAFGGVGTKPWRIPEVEQILTGRKPAAALFEQAAQRAVEGARPLRDNRFKVKLLKRTLVRVLEDLTGVTA